MAIPLAVAPTTPTPGMYLQVNLLAGATSPGSGGLRALIVGPANTTGGDITADTEVRTINTETEIKTAAGAGSLPHLAWKAAQRANRALRCDLLCPTESGGSAASGTITVSGTITTDGNVRCVIMGRVIDVPWLVGETADNWVTKAVTAINAHSDDLFVTASDAVASGAVDLDAKGKGPAGNDVTLRAEITEGCASGSVTVSGANLSGGTTEPDFTTALANVQGTEYDFILLCGSNADVNAASSNNPAALETHIDLLNTGLQAKLQQGVYGSTGTIAAAKTGAVGRNSEKLEHTVTVNGESLPCEFGGWEMGDRMAQRLLKFNANRIGRKPIGLYGSADITSDNPTQAESDDALDNGVTPFGYTANGELYVIRPITTHSQDDSGNQDKRCFDVNEVDAMYEVAKDLRVAIPVEFEGAKVARDRETGDEELPEGVVEERDIKAFIQSRIQEFWVPKGVVNGVEFAAAVAAGELVVQVNDTDETQVDIYIPAKPFKVLSKFGMTIDKVG
jgi:phage tail sheath gpL-like